MYNYMLIPNTFTLFDYIQFLKNLVMVRVCITKSYNTTPPGVLVGKDINY